MGSRRPDPEHELLLCVARTRHARSFADRAREAVRRGVDWPLLLVDALDHGVMPLLYANFDILGPGAAPDRFAHDLRALYLANRYRNLALTAELTRVLALFDAEGLPVVAFGGPLLAALAYGDTALRQASSLDVLVERADVPRAAALLRGAGYVAAAAMTPAQERHHERYAAVLGFTLADAEVSLYVRWRFAPTYLAGGPEPRAALENRRREAFGGQTAPSLDPDDLLFALVLAGALGGWARLGTICDVSELLGSREAWEWPGLIGRARSEGSLRMLLLGVSLAEHLLSAPVPRDVLDLAGRDVELVALRRRVAASLFARADRTRSWRDQLMLPGRALDARRARRAFRWKSAVLPTPSDWRWIRLPDRLFAAYYLVRPLRLLLQATGIPLVRRSCPRPPGAAGGVPPSA